MATVQIIVTLRHRYNFGIKIFVGPVTSVENFEPKRIERNQSNKY